MDGQKIPGVKDAKRPGITARAYGVLVLVALGLFGVAMLVVASLDPEDRGPSVTTFDLAGPAAESCVYDAAAQQMTIKTRLEATGAGAEIVLTAGVRNRDTDAVLITTDRTVQVADHVEESFTFAVDVPADAHADGATSCFVEAATNG